MRKPLKPDWQEGICVVCHADAEVALGVSYTGELVHHAYPPPAVSGSAGKLKATSMSPMHDDIKYDTGEIVRNDW